MTRRQIGTLAAAANAAKALAEAEAAKYKSQHAQPKRGPLHVAMTTTSTEAAEVRLTEDDDGEGAKAAAVRQDD